jgi:hypothetical protein
MSAESESAAQAVAGAVTGKDSPDSVKVTRPARDAIWALLLPAVASWRSSCSSSAFWPGGANGLT